MKRIYKIVVILAVAAGAFFLLHAHVIWLDYFNGTIVNKAEKTVATVTKKGHAQDISEYFLDIETDSGRKVRIQVPQLQYFSSQVNMRVTKAPFSSHVELVQ